MSERLPAQFEATVNANPASLGGRVLDKGQGEAARLRQLSQFVFANRINTNWFCHFRASLKRFCYTILMSLNVEHLTPRDSLLARFDPRWKLLAFLLAIGASAALGSALVLAAALGFSLILAWLAHVTGSWFRTRIAMVAIAVSPFLIILPLTVDRGGPAFEVAGLRFSFDGFVAALALASKTIAIVTLALIVLASAPLSTTLRAAQRMRVPGLLVQLVMLSYRYIFMVLDQLQTLRIALRVRGFRNRTNRHSYRTVGQVTGTLLARSAERAEGVSHAMRCRGFDGTFRGLDQFQTSARDVCLFLVIVATYAALLIWDVLR